MSGSAVTIGPKHCEANTCELAVEEKMAALTHSKVRSRSTNAFRLEGVADPSERLKLRIRTCSTYRSETL
jgi:hypothetical protein